MAGKQKKTFKERIRKSTQRQRHNVSAAMRKRIGVSRRNHNRDDDVDRTGRTMAELVQDVSEGATTALRDNLDARSLADLLTTRADNGRLVLPTAPQAPSPSEAAAEAIAEEEVRLRFSANPADEGNNKNRYKHRGGPYVFWENMGVAEPLVRALKDMKFTHPTPVQEQALPSAMERLSKDTVVSAETGSGKTLVFAMPILQACLAEMTRRGEQTLAAVVPEAAGAEVVAVEKPSKKEKRAKRELKKKLASRKEAAKGKSRRGKRDRDISDADEIEEDLASQSDSDAELEDAPAAAAKRPPLTNVMHSLIVSPTRELAIQLRDCFIALAKYTTIRVGCIVGGMSQPKQQRVLNRHPHVLICTPGRLWELVQKNEGCYLGHSISRRLRYVVLDEADKLLQGGRFEELKSILERIHCDVLPSGLAESARSKKDHYGVDVEGGAAEEPEEEEQEENSDIEGGEEGVWDEATQTFIAKQKFRPLSGVSNAPVAVSRTKDVPRPMAATPPAPEKGHRVVSFVTSATLSLQTNYTKRDIKSKQVLRTTNASTMRKVLHELGIAEKHATIFDLAPESGVVAKIHETYLRCPEKSKDLYLYYFLRTYEERTVIFVNAISMLRRITKILDVLGIPCVGLHAAMQQRQRLKFIDRFKNGDKRVLVATDIASRGLDVDGLRYVIHYQLPRSTDAYIHRCGRTARCGGTGLSVMLVDASEYTAFKKLQESLGRTQQQIEVFALDPTVVHHLHPHMNVALQIDKLQMEIGKTRAGDRWVSSMADAAELEAGDMALDEEGKLGLQSKAKAMRVLQKRLAAMQRQDTGHSGGKGAFRTGAQAVGAKEAVEKMKTRADRQVYKGAKF